MGSSASAVSFKGSRQPGGRSRTDRSGRFQRAGSTYEYISGRRRCSPSSRWKYMTCKGHRMKNHNNKLTDDQPVLHDLRLLLTGTPLQNKLAGAVVPTSTSSSPSQGLRHLRDLVQRPIAITGEKVELNEETPPPDQHRRLQGLPALPPPSAEEGRGVPAAGQGRVHHQVRCPGCRGRSTPMQEKGRHVTTN